MSTIERRPSRQVQISSCCKGSAFGLGEGCVAFTVLGSACEAGLPPSAGVRQAVETQRSAIDLLLEQSQLYGESPLAETSSNTSGDHLSGLEAAPAKPSRQPQCPRTLKP